MQPAQVQGALGAQIHWQGHARLQDATRITQYHKGPVFGGEGEFT